MQGCCCGAGYVHDMQVNDLLPSSVTSLERTNSSCYANNSEET